MKRTIAPLLTGLLLAVSGVSTAASTPKDVPSRVHLLVVGIVEMPDGCLFPAMLEVEFDNSTLGGGAQADLMLAMNDAPVDSIFAIDHQADNSALTMVAGLPANNREGWRKAALATASALSFAVPSDGHRLAVNNNTWGSNAERGGNAYAAPTVAYAFWSA